jgi:hypothetical protein
LGSLGSAIFGIIPVLMCGFCNVEGSAVPELQKDTAALSLGFLIFHSVFMYMLLCLVHFGRFIAKLGTFFLYAGYFNSALQGYRLSVPSLEPAYG